MTSDPRTLFVIGASGGIGSRLTRRLIDQGHTLIAAGRNEDALVELSHATDVETRILDARDGEAVESELAGVLERHGRLDGVVNLAGNILLKPAHLTTDRDFHDTLEINLGTAFNTVRAAAKTMKRGGSVVLMSTVAARVGLANHEAIAAAKAGVEGLARAAAASYAAKGLRVNVVAPGMTETPLSERMLRSEKARKISEEMHPLGRIGQPDEIAAMIAHLLQPESDWVTGQVFGVDGGLSSLRTRQRA